MIRLRSLLLLTSLFLVLLNAVASAKVIIPGTKPGILVLCYHNIGNVKKDPFAISKKSFVKQLDYLRDQGFHPISVQQYIDANEKGAALPSKPVLLSFDDGCESFYTTVYPILKKYHYPAMEAVVGFWENGCPPADVGKVMTWNQIRELDRSGLVTIASHTYNTHHFIPVNPLGDMSEAGSGFAYEDGKYETLAHYKKRINDDFSKAQEIFVKELGHKAVALVWPFGEYTMTAVKIAEKNGFKVCFGLGQGYNPIGMKRSMDEAERAMLFGKPTLSRYAAMVKKWGSDDRALKAAWVNINDFYDPHSIQKTNENVQALINHYYNLGINTIFLQAAATDQSGRATGTYFYNTEAPITALAYDHIARLFRAQGIYVYAWLPEQQASQLVGGHSTKITDLYAELAQYSFLDGVVFEDGKESDALSGKGKMERKAILKVVHNFKPYAKFVDVLYPESFGREQEKSFFSKDYEARLAQYDYLLFRPGQIGHKPTLKEAKAMCAFVGQAMKVPNASLQVIAEVPAFDWRDRRWFLDRELRGYIQGLKKKGVKLFDFYPDAVYSPQSGF
jgi:biofilm PGA synthesis lipoprotein PgaB